MKVLKYISIALFLTLLFVLQIEARQSNLIRLPSRFYQALPPGEEMGGLDTALQIAHKNQVGIFFVIRSTPSLMRTNIDIYADEVSRQVLQEKGFEEGMYASIFSGVSYIRFHEPNSEAFETSTKTLCMVGEAQQIQLTVMNYHPMDARARASAPRAQTLSGTIILLWIGLGIFAVLMTWLEIQFDKKRFLLKMLSGASAGWMMLGNILLDNAVYLGIVGILSVIFSRGFAYSMTEKRLFIYLLLGVLVLNTMAHLISLKVSYKEVFYGANISLNRMGDCFLLKALVLGAGLLLFGLMGPKLFWGIRTLSHYQETKDYSDCVFLGVMPISGDEDEYFMRNMDVVASYSDLFSQAWGKNQLVLSNRQALPAPVGIASLDLYAENPDYIVLVNRHTKGIEKLLSPEQQDQLAGKTLILYPGLSRPGERLLSQIRNYMGERLWFLDQEEMNLQSYRGFRMLAFTEDETMPYMMASNPLMLYVGDAVTPPSRGGYHLWNLMHIPFKISEEDADAIVAEYGMKTQAFDIPSYCWDANVAGFRETIFSGTVLVALIIMECLLLLLTVRLEYLIKARELALKSILGYRLFEQNMELFVLNTVSTLLAGITVCVLCVLYELAPWRYILIGVLAILLFEYAILYITCGLFSRKNTPAILKGGSL